LKVPLFIHIPGHGKGETISTVSGQIDLKPTILSLLGIEHKNDIYFGNDLFAKNRKGYIALRNGDFVSDDYLSTAGMCYDVHTGELADVEDEATSEEESTTGTSSTCDEIA